MMLTKDKVLHLYTDHIKSCEERFKYMGKKLSEQYMIGVVDFLNVVLDELEKEERKEDGKV